MTGEERRQAQHDREVGTAAALQTIYEPERAAQARFDALLDQLDAADQAKGGQRDGVA